MRHVWEWGLVIAITMYIMYQAHLLMNTSKIIVSLPSPWVLYIGLEVYFLSIIENQVDERNLLYFILIIFLLRTYIDLHKFVRILYVQISIAANNVSYLY